MKKVVVLNMYGMKNIGDAAICTVALKAIDEYLNGKGLIYTTFIDQKENLKNYNVKSKLTNIDAPYSTAIASKDKPVSSINKIVRFLGIFITSLFLAQLNGRHLIDLRKNKTYRYIQELRDADVVVSMGGGYIRTKSKFKDYFGLFLTLLPIYLAKSYKKPILFLPMSFGNFATRLHEKIAIHVLIGTTVMCRDKISLKRIKDLDKNKKINAFFSPDLALSIENPIPKNNKAIGDNYIVLTAREWMSSHKQKRYEKELAELVTALWHKLKTYFIPMATNKAEDDDHRVAYRIKEQLEHAQSFHIVSVKSLPEIQRLLTNAKFSICTRMHSAILSFTTKTPFITIGYESKTKGLMQFLNLEKWHNEIEDVRAYHLLAHVNDLLKANTYKDYIATIESKKITISDYHGKIINSIRQLT